MAAVGSTTERGAVMPKNIKCRNCNNLRNHWCDIVIDSPDENMIRDCSHFWEKTNADSIRAMSDEELAELLSQTAYAGATPWCEPFARKFCDRCPTVEGTIKETGQTMDFNECDFADGKCPHGSDVVWWLQQPAEEVSH